MTTTNSTVRKLEHIADELREDGKESLARQVSEVIAEVRDLSTVTPRISRDPEGGVISTGEAARLLGVRSINTIKRWASNGLLEGYRRGGRIMVSRASVDRLITSPTVSEQKRFEAEQDRVWDSLDIGDEPPLPITAPPGRRPWDKEIREAP